MSEGSPNDRGPRTPAVEEGRGSFGFPAENEVRHRINSARNDLPSSPQSEPEHVQPLVPSDETRRRNKKAFAGICVFGGIIIVAIIIVAIKEGTYTGPAGTQRLRSSNPDRLNSVTTTTNADDSTTTTFTTVTTERNEQSKDETTITTESLRETTTVTATEEGSNESTEKSSTAKNDKNPDASELCDQLKGILALKIDSNDKQLVDEFDCSSFNGSVQHDVSADDIQSYLDSTSAIQNLIEEIKDSAWLDRTKVIGDFFTQLTLTGTVSNNFRDLKNDITLLMGQDGQQAFQDGPDQRSLGSSTDTKSSGSGSSEKEKKVVFCDPRREKRCRDKTQCYHVARHCDFEIDCRDFSDEDSCTCPQRLIDERFCDGYSDCQDGEDEAKCGCGADQFFCSAERIQGDKECVPMEFVCDGFSDCGNGRDEEDCLLLAPSTPLVDINNFNPADSNKQGLLTVKLEGKRKYLALVEKDEVHLSQLASKACNGLLERDYVKYETVELDTMPAQEEIAVLKNWTNSRFKVESAVGSHAHYHLAHVECVLKTCEGFKALDKRAHDMPDELFGLSNEEIQQGLANGTIVKPDDSGARIVGGIVADETAWPSTVAIYRNHEFICGGSLVTTKHIMTAAHCLDQYNAEESYFYRVRLGMVRKQSQSPWEQNRYISEVYIYDDYQKWYLLHDLAIGRLDREVNINKYVQPSCLPPSPKTTPVAGQSCTAAGWGVLSENGFPSEVLKEISLDVNKHCKSSFNNISYQICAGSNRGEDTCKGDSGGPLYCKDRDSGERYLAGVVSHGNGCGREGEPGVYVRLSSYLDWIIQVLAGTKPKIGEPLQTCPGFTCGSGECVPVDKMCDSAVLCLDNMDVKHCGNLQSGETPPGAAEEENVKESENHQNDHTEDDNSTNSPRVVPAISVGSEYNLTVIDCASHEFACTILAQCISNDKVCDDVFDCYDRSDEIGCTCGTKLKRTNPELINDGYPDCEDSSDETEDKCGDDQYRCSKSDKCIAKTQLCDDHVDCESGEDESNCFVLAKSNPDQWSKSKSFRNTTGYLFLRAKGQWMAVCLPMKKMPEDLGARLCSYMGFSDLVSAKMVKKGDSPIADSHGASQRSCQHILLDCGAIQCGDTKVIRQAELAATQVPNPGSLAYPWSVSLFSSGKYVCSGSIIHQSFIITSYDCGVKLLTAHSKLHGGVYMTALAGQDRVTQVGLSSHAQIRRLVRFRVIPQTQIAIGFLEKEFVFTDTIGKLCLTSATWIPQGVLCSITGKYNDNWAAGYSLTVSGVCNFISDQIYYLCTCDHPGIPEQSYCRQAQRMSSPNTTTWSGALACPDNSGHFYAIGLYYSDKYKPPTKFDNLIAESIRNGIPSLIKGTLADPPSSSKDECKHRCKIGNCVKSEQICDGKWDCNDGSDEKDCQAYTVWPVCTKTNSTEERCTCPEGHGKCLNNLCIPAERYCNQVNDCGDGSDEATDCKLCINRLRFSDPDKLCNGKVDCDDGSDEAPEICGCTGKTFRCSSISGYEEDSSECLPEEKICDAEEDCPSGIDEDPKMCIALGRYVKPEEEPVHKLLRPEDSKSGYLKFRLRGRWYFYCHEAWEEEWSLAICKRLGYSRLQMWLQHLPVSVEDLGELETGVRVISKTCQIVHIVCDGKLM